MSIGNTLPKAAWMVAALALCACDEPTKPSSMPSFDSYAARGADNGWPTLGDGAVQLSDNPNAPNYYVVVDGSGSMENVECSDGEPKLAVAKRALAAFLDRLPPGANVGVFAFDDDTMGERVRLAAEDRDAAKDAIRALRSGGGTPLSTAVAQGYEALMRQAVAQLGYGEYHLVVVTDGEASSGYAPEREIERLLEQSPVVLHTIGFCIDDDHSLNRPGYTLYKSANDPAALQSGLDAVLAEAPDFQLAAFEDES